MGLANCPECGKLYLENPSKLCQDCYALQEIDEEKVVNFLREKRKSTLQEIHEATGVRHKVILQMLNRHRITSDITVSYPCETCGEPITEGRICGKCNKNILDQIKPEPPKAPEPEQGRRRDQMYTGDRFRGQ